MSLLHDYFNTRNLQAFQRLLDGQTERGPASTAPASSGAPGSSYTGGGKSWTRNGGGISGGAGSACKVNARDWLGRTVLHLACNAVGNIEYVRALLKHPNIDVNLPDTESLWTPLHRALYAANLPVALLLLQCPDIDNALKDLEGYTAFDLYNSTVNGTKPDEGEADAELYTWGANRNAALGVGDENDRAYPEHVTIQSKEDAATMAKRCLTARLSPILVRQVQMSKLHTAVVTAEREGNLRLCGFGSGGRLGPAQHTQYSLNPLSSFNLEVARVALGQDHTLALTRSGEVYSWGLNRFSQLGYVVETSPSTNGRLEEPIQSVPKRLVGLLRREVVRGVAASKNASACWTNDIVFTWGTNTGQLGYDKNAQPVQITPRPVTKFSNTVIDLAMSDTVLAALLVSRHVECIWNDRHFRISFPIHAFPTGIEPYRPPQSIKDSRISKVTCCDDTFAALSLNGEVFTFSPPKSTGDTTATGEGRAFAPQRIWALRKKFSAVKDVALGSEGSIIICTESGHVFVRTRNTKNASAKAFKFERVPFLQRVTQVCANSTGAFGALKVDYKPKPIEVTGNTIAQDMKQVQPYLRFYSEDGAGDRHAAEPRTLTHTHADDEPEDDDIEGDIFSVLELCRALACERRMRKQSGGNINYSGAYLPHGADTMMHLHSGEAFPVHRAVLAARSPVLAGVLAGSGPVVDAQSKLSIQLLAPKSGPGAGVPQITRMALAGVHPLAMLILLHYLYSDELLAVWDRRIGMTVYAQAAGLGVGADAEMGQVRGELQALARVLGLTAATHALEAPVRRVPAPTMGRDMAALFDVVQAQKRPAPLAPDVVLQLKDRDVYTHSVVLRARSPLFASFFGLEDWSAKRWGADGVVRVNMRHLTAHVMEFVVGFMCCGADEEIFRSLDFIQSTEELIPFMFEVLAGANELHLDRLILLCASVIQQHTSLGNACYVLADATHFRVPPLVEAVHEYMAAALEALLQARMLDALPYALVKQLAQYAHHRQVEKAPFARGGAHVQALLERHAAWLALQDIPEPTMRHTAGEWRREGAPSRVQAVAGAKARVAVDAAPHTLRRPPSGDDIFLMDDADAPSPAAREAGTTQPALVWKAHGPAPRVDMKAVMAEAASQRAPASRQPGYSVPARAGASRTPFASGTPEGPAGSLTLKASPKSGTSPAWRTSAPSTPAGEGSAAGAARGPPGAGAPPTTPSKAKPKGSESSLYPTTTTGLLSGTRPPATTPAAPPSPGPSAPALGPVITPTRQMSSKGSGGYARTAVTGTKAWAQPQPLATERAPAVAEAQRGMSFVAIQHLQQEQVAPVRDRRTLREIQAEEHALQEEAEFLKWWTAEEERVQQETLALTQFESALNQQRPARKPRPPKQKKAEAPAAAPAPAPSPGGSGSQQKPPRKTEQTSSPRRPRKPRQTPA